MRQGDGTFWHIAVRRIPLIEPGSLVEPLGTSATGVARE